MGLLEGRRKRKAEEESERQRAEEVALAADRQRVVEELEGLIEDSRTNFGIDAPGFEEKKGERTFAIMEGVALIEPRRQAWNRPGAQLGVLVSDREGRELPSRSK